MKQEPGAMFRGGNLRVPCRSFFSLVSRMFAFSGACLKRNAARGCEVGCNNSDEGSACSSNVEINEIKLLGGEKSYSTEEKYLLILQQSSRAL